MIFYGINVVTGLVESERIILNVITGLSIFIYIYGNFESAKIE